MTIRNNFFVYLNERENLVRPVAKLFEESKGKNQVTPQNKNFQERVLIERKPVLPKDRIFSKGVFSNLFVARFC